jgi:hypothetical protein
MRALVDLKLLAAECKHLGHERHAVKLPVAVERVQDFVLAPDFYPVADCQLRSSGFIFLFI